MFRTPAKLGRKIMSEFNIFLKHQELTPGENQNFVGPVTFIP